jgi:hypothetical protein
MRYIVLSSALIAYSVFCQESRVEDSAFKHVLCPIKGPVKELDAYLSYVIDFTYLSDHDDEPLSTGKLKRKLLCTVYGDQLGLSFKNKRNDRLSVKVLLAPEHDFEEMRGVESLIELGLEQLVNYTLERSEIEIYMSLRYRLAELAHCLSDDQQKRYWVSLMRRVTTVEDKQNIFEACREVQDVIERVRGKLDLYDKLIMRALSARANCGISSN